MGTASTWRDKLKQSQSKAGDKANTTESSSTNNTASRSMKSLLAKSKSHFSFASKKKTTANQPTTPTSTTHTIKHQSQEFSPEPILPALTPTSQASALGIVPPNEQRFTALITGGSSGIGYYAAKQLALDYPNCTIIIASRNGEAAVDRLRLEVNRTTGIYYAPLDLSSQQSIRQFASEWKSHRYPYVHYLLLNAGVCPTAANNDVVYSVDEFEYAYSVNYLGHYLLYQLLRPCLSPAARIVVTACNTSGTSTLPAAEYTSAKKLALPEDEDDQVVDADKQQTQSAEEFSYQHDKQLSSRSAEETASTVALRRYTTSKLALIYFANELYERLQQAGSKQSVVIYDAGYVVGTQLYSSHHRQGSFVDLLEQHVYPWITPLMRLCGVTDVQTANEAGKNLATITLDRAVVYSGAYYNRNIDSPSDDDSNINHEHQADLWKESAAMTANSPIETKRFELV